MRTLATASVGGPTPHIPDLAAEFRLAMRQLGAQVSIVAAGTGTSLTGMTVTTLSSLSVDPPAVSVAIAKSASIHPVILATRRFGASGLGAAHVSLADRFAGRDGSKGAERFAVGRWTGLDGGAPSLADAVFALDCRVEHVADWPSHSLILARVAAVRVAPGLGLAYRDGTYGTVEPFD
jgi:flavin reductase (DIM6/NTAB) family NADH-FMN oxidoreductase RutF